MAAPENLTKAENIKLQAKEIDFISRFQDTWEALREILGIMRPIRKQPGTKLVASTATVTLQDGNVAEGDVVPYSQAEVTPVVYEDLTIEKFRKGVSIEAVSKFGAAVAVQKTDDAFLKELQGVVLDRFYDFLQTGTLTDTENSFQMAVSMAVTLVKNKFKTMRKDYTNIVCFVNTMDVGLYQGSATITIQNRAGIEYAKDFMGANTMIISSEIPQGTVIAIPADNIVLYYIDPSDADIAELGLFYTTWGETSLIGVNKTGNYERVIGDTNVIMGMKLFAEYLDGISVVTISDNTAVIAPMLLITFVENAFKYGVSSHNDSVISIRLLQDNDRISFNVRNSVFPELSGRKGDGIGLANCRKRLALIYPDAHRLSISDSGDAYEADLTIMPKKHPVYDKIHSDR